jgi:hypothetical protein
MDLIELKKALSEMEIKYEKAKQMRTCDGVIHNVDITIKDPSGREVGLEKTEKGTYRFITDSTGMSEKELKEQKSFLNRIRQRYAYNKITSELKKQGYVIAEEEKVQNNTIRLVARKWS